VPQELFEPSVNALPEKLPFCSTEHGCFRVNVNFDAFGKDVTKIGGEVFELKSMGEDDIADYNIRSAI
jgi:hypothetical protein